MTNSAGHVTRKGAAKKAADTQNSTKKERDKHKTVRHVKSKGGK